MVRSADPIPDDLKYKISRLCDVHADGVVNAADAGNIYEIPLVLHEEGLDERRVRGAPADRLPAPDLREWEALVSKVEAATRPVRIGIIGKYVALQDAYLSVVEATKHGGFEIGADVEFEWIQAEEVEGLMADGRLRDLDGVVIPGGFGERGTEGKIEAARYRASTTSRASACASACR